MRHALTVTPPLENAWHAHLANNFVCIVVLVAEAGEGNDWLSVVDRLHK